MKSGNFDEKTVFVSKNLRYDENRSNMIPQLKLMTIFPKNESKYEQRYEIFVLKLDCQT